jgi:hypothetical protein
MPIATASVPETVARVFKPIQQFTRGWMMAPETDRYGEQELGLSVRRQFWIVGRGGVLGSCPTEVAVAAIAFVPADRVAPAWEHLPAGLTHFQVAEHYCSRIVAWGNDALAVFDPARLERLDTLGRRIIDAAPASLGALFAGWRVMAQPRQVEARVALTTHVLREMRGAAHIAAITALGLSPLDAILASTNAPPRTGPAYAEQMGFVGPFRDPEEVRARRLEAESLTASALEPYFAVLSPSELADFGELVETTRHAIDM